MEKLLSTSIISVQFSFKHIYVDSERKGEDYSVCRLFDLFGNYIAVCVIQEETLIYGNI